MLDKKQIWVIFLFKFKMAKPIQYCKVKKKKKTITKNKIKYNTSYKKNKKQRYYFVKNNNNKKMCR